MMYQETEEQRMKDKTIQFYRNHRDDILDTAVIFACLWLMGRITERPGND